MVNDISPKIKMLLFSLMVVLVSFAVLINLSREEVTVFEGEGMMCFEKCDIICSNRDSKIISFTATSSVCGCTCSDKYQEMWRIEK